MQIKYSSMIFLIQNLTLSFNSCFPLPLFLPFIFFPASVNIIFALFLLCVKVNLIFVSIIRVRYWFKDSCLALILEKQFTQFFWILLLSHPLFSELYYSYWENVLHRKTARFRTERDEPYLIVKVSGFMGHVVSVTTTGSCHCPVEAATDTMRMNGVAVSSESGGQPRP